MVKAILKRPVLPPCVVDGLCRNPLYYYYYDLYSKKGKVIHNLIIDYL